MQCQALHQPRNAWHCEREWRLLVKVIDAWEPDDESYPMLVEAEGVAPPQYLEPDEGDA